MTAHIKSDNHIHIVFDNGKSVTVYNSQPIFKELCDAVKRSCWKTAYEIAFRPTITIEKRLKEQSTYITEHVTVENGIVSLNGVPMHGTLIDRMLKMINEQFDVQPMGLFLENLMKNSSYRAVNELYEFLEKSNLPITEDGHFLAYKRVNENFKDIFSGKFDNSPGKRVKMKRCDVDEDANRTCSAGLHFCARSYLSSYITRPGNKIIMIKINPKDVVAIPTDYNNAKGRCCEYEVISEIDSDGMILPIEEAILEKVTVMSTPPAGAVKQFSLQGELIAIHDSPKNAEIATGINASAIRRVCKGHRKTTGGFIWTWVTHKQTSSPSPLDLDDEYQNELDDKYQNKSDDDIYPYQNDMYINLWDIND